MVVHALMDRLAPAGAPGDCVVTVALGSTLATTLLSKDVPLAKGVTALALLVLLQFVVAWSTARSSMVNRIVKSEPALLFYRAQFLRDAMLRERITEEELHASARESSIGSMDNAEAIVLETAATISVIAKSGGGGAPRRMLQGVVRPHGILDSDAE